MSSFVRRIQRTVLQSNPVPQHELPNGKWHYAPNPARRVHFMGRGSKLGTKNPKDAALLARLKREERNRKRREGR